MNCSISWFRKRLAHPSQMQLWHRYVLTHFSPRSLFYEPHSKDNRERGPYFHHYSLLCNTQVRKPVCSLRKARNHTKKIVSRKILCSCTSKKTPSLPIYIGDFKTATSAFAVTLAVTEEPVLCFQTRVFYVA